jgi:hypothetical protein
MVLRQMNDVSIPTVPTATPGAVAMGYTGANPNGARFDVKALDDRVVAYETAIKIWSSAAGYAAGARVMYLHQGYEALAVTAAGESPATAPAKWQALGGSAGTVALIDTQKWDVAQVYTAGNRVAFNGATYQALVATAAGESPATAAAKWQPITARWAQDIAVLTYDVNRAYGTGQYIMFNDDIWKAVATTVAGETPVTTPAKWTKNAVDLSDLEAVKWDAAKTYAVGEQVYWFGILYQAIAPAAVGESPGSAFAKWISKQPLYSEFDALKFDPLRAYPLGTRMVYFVDGFIYEAIANTLVGETPGTHPAKWKSLTPRYSELDHLIWDAAKIYAIGNRVEFNGVTYQATAPTAITESPATTPAKWQSLQPLYAELDALKFVAAKIYAIGNRMVFTDGIVYEALAVTAAGETPVSTPAKWKSLQPLYAEHDFLKWDAAKIYGVAARVAFNGSIYQALAATAAAESPATTPAKWLLVDPRVYVSPDQAVAFTATLGLHKPIQKITLAAALTATLPITPVAGDGAVFLISGQSVANPLTFATGANKTRTVAADPIIVTDPSVKSITIVYHGAAHGFDFIVSRD